MKNNKKRHQLTTTSKSSLCVEDKIAIIIFPEQKTLKEKIRAHFQI